jgi:hypothetical protein
MLYCLPPAGRNLFSPALGSYSGDGLRFMAFGDFEGAQIWFTVVWSTVSVPFAIDAMANLLDCL